MTAAEIETRIDEVDDAIQAALLGQSYTIRTGDDSQTVQRPSISQLRQYRAELERRLSRMQTDGRPASAEVRHHTTR